MAHGAHIAAPSRTGRGGPALPGLLADVLGATWDMGAPVTGVAWFGNAAAAFALADGTVATARAAWDGAGRLRPRDGGGVELIPASAAPPPVMRSAVHKGVIAALASDGAGGVWSAGRDGRIARLAPDGTSAEVARDAGALEALAASADGIAFAVGTRVHHHGEHDELPARVTALRFDPTGAHLAAAHAAGVVVWSRATGWRALDDRDGPYRSLAWSRDGSWLVAGTTAGLRGWRMPDGEPVTLPGGPALPGPACFARDGRTVAAPGGPRAVAWSLDPPGTEPVGYGAPSTVATTRVACHPARPVLAIGYGSGAVLLAQPGRDGVLLVRGPAGGAVTALAWSDDGDTLALGAEGGEIALVAVPDLLFRATPETEGGAS